MQLTLSLTPQDSINFDNFVEGGNKVAIQALQTSLAKMGEQFIYLYGDLGAGRTHLLQACCHWIGQRGGRAAYLPFGEDYHFSPSLLDNLEQLDLVCIDDIDRIAGQREWEEALLYTYDRLKAHQTRFFVSAPILPTELSIHLSDLKSRFSWGWVFHIKPLHDEQKLEVIKARALKRGIHLSEEVSHYLIRHY